MAGAGLEFNRSEYLKKAQAPALKKWGRPGASLPEWVLELRGIFSERKATFAQGVYLKFDFARF